MGQHNYYKDCHKGEYKLIHPEKYMQGIPAPVFKSSWEERMFIVCDVNPFVTLWGYEPFAISYFSPLYQKQSLYKPDIYLECKYPDGHSERYLIEIKPNAYAIFGKEPKAPGPKVTDPKRLENYRKRKAAFDRKNMDVAVNYAKWEAAEAWCKANGVNWLIATGTNMGSLFKKDVKI